MSSSPPVIVVHGGAAVCDCDRSEWRAGVEAAAHAGWSVLETPGGTALDAVQAAVQAMEANPVFNAGLGSCLTSEARVEMDAVIMNGADLSAGAVAGVTTVKSAVGLARSVMEKTDHVLLIGQGAEKFGEKIGIPVIHNDELVTERRKEQLARLRTFHNATNADFNMKMQGHDTVGAVALDSKGNVASATSTGGITGKMPGRVGDSPIVGSGAYADNAVGAASTTGHGESVLKVTLARQALWRMEAGKTPKEAAKAVLDDMMAKVQGRGGIIIVGKDGTIGFDCSTGDMAWAHCSESKGLQSGTTCPLSDK